MKALICAEVEAHLWDFCSHRVAESTLGSRGCLPRNIPVLFQNPPFLHGCWAESQEGGPASSKPLCTISGPGRVRDQGITGPRREGREHRG